MIYYTVSVLKVKFIFLFVYNNKRKPYICHWSYTSHCRHRNDVFNRITDSGPNSLFYSSVRTLPYFFQRTQSIGKAGNLSHH